MPETLSPDIRTGYDTQTAFDMRLDTFNRLNEVFNRPSKDADLEYFDPRHGLASASTTNVAPIPPMDFEDALTSKDPKVRDIALRSLERDANSNPYGRFNVGKEFRTPVNRGVDKFIDDKYGFDMFSDNEDFYYKNSYMDDGWFLRAMKNVLWRFPSRVVVGAATKFVEGVGYLGAMAVNGVIDGAKALAGKETHYWEDVADNAFSKVMKNMDNDFRDYVTPVYKEAGFDERGFFSQLTNYAFWNDSFADGVSFMASMFIPAGIASKTGLLAKGVTLGAEVAADAGLAARIGGGARAALRLATSADTYGEAGLAIFNTANEAAFQATGQYSETKQQLLEARERGENNYTDKEIQDFSGKAAASSFGWNFPALMISNAWEMKNVIKPLAGRAKNTSLNTSKRVALEDTGHVGFKPYKSGVLGKIANSYVGKVATKYVPIAAKGTLVEGFWEENIQTAIDRAGRGQYTRFGDDTDSKGMLEKANGGFFGILEQFFKQTYDASTWIGGKGDREIASSIGVGALLGAGGGTIGAKFGRRIVPGEFIEKNGKQVPRTSFFIGERRQAAKALNLAFMEINNAYNNFLSVQDVRKEDGTIDEAKLAAKVGAFESFAAKQEILDDLKANKAYKPEELQMLQNNLLNDYVRGLAKVGKVDDAVKRMQELANRNVDSKSETFISNPLETAKYLSEAAKIYNEEQAKPNHVSSKYSPAEMEQVNTAIKDRSFDLRAARLAMDPVLKNYEKQASDNLNELLGFLQSGPELQETLTRLRARDYIEAIAKRDVYQSLLDKDAPEFLKDYHKSKIKEADDAMARYNKELGENAPAIDKDGKIQFKDKNINFEDKYLIRLLDVYKNAYSDVADVEFMQQHNEHIAKSITDPVNGLANWEDYLEYVKRAIEKSNLPTEAAPTTPTATDAKPVDLQPIINKVAKGEVLTDEELEIYDKNKKEVDRLAKRKPTTTTATSEDDKDDEDKNNTEDTVDKVITDENKGGKEQTDKVDPENPLSWYTPLKSSTDDTNLLGEESEQLRDIPYDELRKLVIREMMSDVADFNSKYKLFMVKDVYPEIYRKPANNENQEDVIPSGEVIIIEKADGTIATMRDFFGNKYKDMADMTVVFSAEDKIFRDSHVAERAAIWARKMKATSKDATDFYDKEHQRGLSAREMIKKNPAEKIQIELIEATDGVLPTTKNVVGVIERFGDKFTISVTTKEDKKYRGGSILATIGKVSFPVGTMKLRMSATELLNVQKIIEMSFDTKEAARQLRNNYLNVMFHTDKELARFRVKKVGEKYKIVFEKLNDKDLGLSSEERQAALKESTAYGELRFNVSKKALEEGMNKFDAVTGEYTFITADEYQEFVKSKAVTSLKKTIDKDGKLYMKPVNAYFSFNIIDPRLAEGYVEKRQEYNYDKILASIEQLHKDGKIDVPIQKANLKQYQKVKHISQEQFTKLNERLDEIAKEQKAATKKTKEKVVSEKKTIQAIPEVELNKAISTIKFNPETENWEATIHTGQGWDTVKNPESRERLIEELRKYRDKVNKEQLEAPFKFIKEQADNEIKFVDTSDYKDGSSGHYVVAVQNTNRDYINLTAVTKQEVAKKLKDFIDSELAALEGKKVEVTTSPVKTEKEEEDEEAAFKKRKAAERAKKKEKADIGETVGNVTGKADQAPYTIEYQGHTYFLNLTNGYVTRKFVAGPVVRDFVLNRNDKDFVPILEELTKAFPFRKNEDGTMFGILKSQFETEDSGVITAYGLPIAEDADIYVDSTGKVIRTKDIEQMELSSTPFVRSLLTDKGKVQLEEFLKRNC